MTAVPHVRCLASSRFATLAALAVLFAAVPVQAQQRPRLANDEQLRVNQAISEGTKYLIARQKAQNDGSFPGPGHPVGVTALAGLALMEAGMDSSSPEMRAAAQYILAHLKSLDDTYDLSLAILFLDRFGENKYKSYIQMLALRLIGGQTTTGGWSYKCPIFSSRDQNELLRVLRRLEREEKGEALPGIAGGRGKENLPPIGIAGGKGAAEQTAGSASTSEAAAQARVPRPGMCIKSADSTDAPVIASDGGKPDGAPPAGGEQPQKRPRSRINVSGALALLPVLQEFDKLGEVDPRGHPDRPAADKDPKGRTDNSNTQFAILAMWTAKRHQIPVSRTLKLIVKRFRESQDPDGGWVYGYSKPGTSDSAPAMTCSGLAGLAVGFGLTDGKRAANEADKQLVKMGFRCLMKFIMEPSEKWEKPVPLVNDNNLYYLWSIERVAVMFNLPTLGSRDWYRWGAEILVTNQSKKGLHAGAWENGGNTTLADPVVNTSFALLFLKGANLTSDLTPQLPINPEELNKELAGGGGGTILRTKVPGKKDSDPLGEEKVDEVAPVPPPVTPEAPKTQPVQPVQQATAPPPTTTAAKTESKSSDNTMMIVIFAIVAVVVIAGVGAAIYFATRTGKKTDDDDDKPRRPQRAKQAARDNGEDDEEEKPRPKPAFRAGPRKRPTRARYDDDDDDD